MSHTLTILHCLRAPRGGLLRHVDDLARGQIELGHRVGIICDADPGNQRDQQKLDALARDLPLGVSTLAIRRMPGVSDVRALNAVTKLISNINPDVVHGHGAKGGFFGRIGATLSRRKTGRPIARIYTPHGGSLHYSPKSMRGFLFLLAERMLLKATDGLVFVSDFEARTYSGHVGSPVCPWRRVHNGLSDEEFEPLDFSEDATDIVYLGELRYLKGVDVLINALSTLRPGLSMTATIVGSGPDEHVLRKQVRDKNLDNSIRFVEPMRARDAFRLGHIVVVPSRAESLPYVVLEGLAAGRPLIATNVGGIPEILPVDMLIPPDDVPALANALRMMKANPTAGAIRARAMAADARSTFSRSAMCLQITDFYGEAIDFTRTS